MENSTPISQNAYETDEQAARDLHATLGAYDDASGTCLLKRCALHHPVVLGFGATRNRPALRMRHAPCGNIHCETCGQD